MDSFSGRPRRKKFRVGFVVGQMEMGICFANVPFPPCCMSGNFQSFFRSMSLDRSGWPRCLLWHGWLPGLSLYGERDPWAASFGQLACSALECCLGAYLADNSSFWTPPDFWDVDDIALEMTDAPFIWTNGSGEPHPVGGFQVAGAGVYLPAPELAVEGAVWRVAEEYGGARLEGCRAFMPVLGPLQTVQRAELWGAIVALQAYWPCHLGIDNLW